MAADKTDFGLRWDELGDAHLYVIDLIQYPDGLRRIRLRRETDEPHRSAVLRTKPYTGANLAMWANDLTLTANVELLSGGSFVEEAHGGWMTDAEFGWWRGPRDTAPKWFNDIPPKLPPK